MKEYMICEAEEAFPVEIIYSRRKSLGLQIKSDGRVYARVPAGTADEVVRYFIEKHTAWILRKRSRLVSAPQGQVTRLPEVTTEAGKQIGRAHV